MILKVYAVLDSATMAFARPMFMNSDTEAMRSFMQYAVDKESPIYNSPADYTVYHIGEYDDGSGVITGCAPRKVYNGIEATKDYFDKKEKLDALRGEIEKLENDEPEA